MDQLLDILIPKNDLKEKHELFAQRGFVAIMLFIFTIAIVFFLLQTLTSYTDPFPFWIIMIVVPSILSINKGLNKPALGINLFNSIFALVIGYLISVTGGVFSINVKWLFVLLFFSLLFLPFKQISFWVAIILIIIVFNYVWVDATAADIPGFNKTTYLIDNVLFIVVFSSFIAIYYRFQVLLRNDLSKEKESTTRQTKALQIQSNKLAELSKKLEKSNTQLKNYAYTTSHDLRQPLRTISSFVKLIKRDLEQDQIGEHTKEFMDFVIDASNKSNKMVDDILDYAQVENVDNKPKEIIPTDYLIKNVMKSLKNQIDEKSASIEVASLPIIHGNPARIERLFQNLISNALKYSKADEVPSIKISCCSNQNYHTFLVEDKGIGITANNLETIFEPFVQENRAHQFGQGIGLATCKDIIESHNGTIWAESKQEEYTKFFFTIPKTV